MNSEMHISSQFPPMSTEMENTKGGKNLPVAVQDDNTCIGNSSNEPDINVTTIMDGLSAGFKDMTNTLMSAFLKQQHNPSGGKRPAMDGGATSGTPPTKKNKHSTATISKVQTPSSTAIDVEHDSEAQCDEDRVSVRAEDDENLLSLGSSSESSEDEGRCHGHH